MREPMLKEDVREDVHQPSPAEEVVEALKLTEGEGPGQYLRQVREKRGLAEEDVAVELGLLLKQVQALEENDYEVFPAPIYVRSHLRRYAELLELPVEPVIDAFRRTGESDPPPLRRVSIRQQISSRTTTIRWVTYLFIAALLVLLAAWWQSNGFAPASNNDVEQPAQQPDVPSSLELRLPQVQPSIVPENQAE